MDNFGQIQPCFFYSSLLYIFFFFLIITILYCTPMWWCGRLGVFDFHFFPYLPPPPQVIWGWCFKNVFFLNPCVTSQQRWFWAFVFCCFINFLILLSLAVGRSKPVPSPLQSALLRNRREPHIMSTPMSESEVRGCVVTVYARLMEARGKLYAELSGKWLGELIYIIQYLL
mgnify:CR=1 FL=1